MPVPVPAKTNGAKGNLVRIPAISTFRIENGKIAEGWELYDSGDMARQMAA